MKIIYRSNFSTKEYVLYLKKKLFKKATGTKEFTIVFNESTYVGTLFEKEDGKIAILEKTSSHKHTASSLKSSDIFLNQSELFWIMEALTKKQMHRLFKADYFKNKLSDPFQKSEKSIPSLNRKGITSIDSRIFSTLMLSKKVILKSSKLHIFKNNFFLFTTRKKDGLIIYFNKQALSKF